jgi:hypothetical protein
MADGPVPNLYFRAARSSQLDLQPDGRYLINGVIHLRLKAPNGAQVQLRESNGARELLVPITLTNGQATIEEEIEW